MCWVLFSGRVTVRIGASVVVCEPGSQVPESGLASALRGPPPAQLVGEVGQGATFRGGNPEGYPPQRDAEGEPEDMCVLVAVF